jgi:lipopolysaccharide/colanic/teichoic acid biosynthesis glycosyltransferase
MNLALSPAVPWSGRRQASGWPLSDRRLRARPRLGRNIHYWHVRPEGNRSAAYQACKRLLDLVGACVLLILLSPVLIITFAILCVCTRGKPLFRQTRIGECGRKFTLYKFRTMVLAAESMQRQVKNEKDGPVFKNRRDPRITRIGAVLRKFSIDEMPQLFNVIRGQMSLVGPRPPIESEVLKYENWQLRRLAVKPGLTCLWQISGRCEIGFLQWVRLDLWYIDHQSLLLDLILLVKTPWCVLSGRGAY